VSFVAFGEYGVENGHDCTDTTTANSPTVSAIAGHDGIAVNVTMLPGDLVLYESHSILHGKTQVVREFSFVKIQLVLPLFKFNRPSVPTKGKIHGKHFYSL
jgi:hypothetical protein